MDATEGSEKPPLLFLCHRIPFPPNKGDKIRSFHLLKYLSQRYRIFLGAFIDDPVDRRHQQALTPLVEEHFLVELKPRISRLASLRGLLSNEALSVCYFRHRKLAAKVRDWHRRHNIERAVVYSSAMAQYLLNDGAYRCRVADMVDVDSEKWREYAAETSFPLSWIYQREANTLLRFEKRVASTLDASLFVSAAEARRFSDLVPDCPGAIASYDNGVDTDYFSPHRDYSNPYNKKDRVLVFTGAMDYRPNIDAVSWFAREVFPRLLTDNPDLCFYIVGANPSPEVCSLGEAPGVEVTGRVEDIRPYLAHALMAVAPLRIARGVQNKVLEAMAMARPVVVSGAGLEGIDAEPGHHLLQADRVEDYVCCVSALLTGEFASIGAQAREQVKDNYVWERNLPLVGRLLEGGALVSSGQTTVQPSHG